MNRSRCSMGTVSSQGIDQPPLGPSVRCYPCSRFNVLPMYPVCTRPPPHIHRTRDESFYILEGTFDFSLAGQAFTAGAGAFVYLPKGVVHTHRAGGGAPARALVIQSPAGVERFIEEAGKRATDPSVRPAPPARSELESI